MQRKGMEYKQSDSNKSLGIGCQRTNNRTTNGASVRVSGFTPTKEYHWKLRATSTEVHLW